MQKGEVVVYLETAEGAARGGNKNRDLLVCTASWAVPTWSRSVRASATGRNKVTIYCAVCERQNDRRMGSGLVELF